MTVIFLHGGGDSPAARGDTFGRFLDLTGLGATVDRRPVRSGAGGPLLLIAVADGEEEARETADSYRALFAALGAPENRLLPLLLAPDRLLTAQEVAACEPSGIFVCGGATPLYHRALCADLNWVAYLREHHIPFGGTSAGAAIAAERAILGGWQSPGDGEAARPILFQGAGEGLARLTVRPGARLVPFAVDVHAGQWGTLTRLFHVARGGLVDEGWAIDEDTCLIVWPERVEIAGRGYAYHVARDGRGGATVRALAAPADH